MAPVSAVVERDGICPRCGGLGVYKYTVKAPVGDEAVMVEVGYEFHCLACGHSERRRVLIPLEAAFMMRYIFDPEVRGVVERARLIAEVRGLLAAREQA